MGNQALLSQGVQVEKMFAQTAGGVQSDTAAAIASSGTITTSGPPQVGVARVSPTSAVTGVIMQAGTTPGQTCWVVNEATSPYSVTFAASGTSNVADGVNDIIQPLQAKLYVWDSGTSLWYSVSQLVNGTIAPVQSASAAATASSGTIATANVGVARVSPAAAITGVILAAGTLPGQQCWIINEAVAANTVTFAASGTSNVAGGVNDVIPGLQARLFVWDSGTSLWYATPQLATTTALTQSGSAAATGAAGTITTASVGVARISPAAARTGVIMQAGTAAGQLCLVVNEATVEKSVQMDAAGTSNVADGVNCIIPGLSSRLFVWDSGTSLWYEITSLVGGKLYSTPSATAAVTAGSGTIATAGVGVARSNPAGNITGVVLEAGTYQGQEVWVSNESANTITFASSNSNVADANTAAIAANTARKFVWIGSLWYRAA